VTKPVRVGVLGTSMFAEILHLEYLAADSRAELVAICGRDQERAQVVARKYRIPRVFADWRELLDRAPLDAIVVVTPDDLHYPMAMAALERGLHVLCEKPLANTAAQARALYETAERKRVTHMTMFTTRWMPGFRHARRLVEEGYLGRLYHATFRHLGSGARQARYRWRRDASRGHGMLADFGSHKIDTARCVRAAGDQRASRAPHTPSRSISSVTGRRGWSTRSARSSPRIWMTCCARCASSPKRSHHTLLRRRERWACRASGVQSGPATPQE
jgi:predicted dehydrogenase